MPLLNPTPEPVPFEEVAEALGRAAARVGGGPAGLVSASGQQLTVALEVAGFRVVREVVPGPQVTL